MRLRVDYAMRLRVDYAMCLRVDYAMHNTLLFSTSKSELLAVERQVKVGIWSQKCNLLFSNPEISRWKH